MRPSEWDRFIMRGLAIVLLAAVAIPFSHGEHEAGIEMAGRIADERARNPAAGGNKASVSCDNLESSVESIPSKGAVDVPVTIGRGDPFKSADAMIAINKKFNASEIERLVLDPKIDPPSQARLLEEFRCFGTWKRQHDFYRKVLRLSSCALLRHKATVLLEHDVCNAATVRAYINEYSTAGNVSTREWIARKLGTSHDESAISLVDEAARSKSKTIAAAALAGRLYGKQHPCSLRDGDEKPHYGLPEVGELCDSLGETGSKDSIGNEESEIGGQGDAAGVENVRFDRR